MSKLDQVVFIIKGGKIVEGTIRSFDGYIDETTNPLGIGPRYHVRGAELWTWGFSGNNARLVCTYDTEEQAFAALEDSFYYDFWGHQDTLAFSDRESAEKCLAQILGE